MKKFHYLIAATALFLAACTPKQKDDLVIDIKNMNPQMATLNVQNVSDMNDGWTDTLYPDNGVFRYNYPEPQTYETNIKFFDNGEMIKSANGPARLYVVYFPQDKIKVEAEITKDGKFVSRTGGTELYDQMQKFNDEHSKELAKSDSLRNLISDPAYKGDKSAMQKEVTETWRNIHAAKEKYILEHPNSDLSGYFLSVVDPDSFERYYNSIDARVKDGKMKDYIAMIKKYYDDEAAAEKARAGLSQGAIAYNFTLKDINGNDFSLSSLRGKHVVLDFWGSWCSYCIQGLPRMKELYAKYKGKLEIVGIDCEEPEAQWEKAVKEYSLPWINVYNGDNGVDTRYGVSGFPTKIVVGPDGKIIETFEGENPEFYVSVEKIMALTK